MANRKNNNWYTISDIGSLDSPALVVYPARVKDNIRRLKEMVGDDTARLRPHVKTHKSPDATRLLLDAGIHKFKCATIAEAEMLATCGAPDVLLAYQPVGPKLQRFIKLIREYPSTKFSCLIDKLQAAEEMDQAFSAARLDAPVPVYIDLNLGMNRTGITPGQAALDLYRKFSDPRTANHADTTLPGNHANPTLPGNHANPTRPASPGILTVGLHAYDGHIRDADMQQRIQKCEAAFAQVEQLKGAIRQIRLQDVATSTPSAEAYPYSTEIPASPLIVAGGSPTFSIHCRRPGIECSPGTFIYWDKRYSDACPEQSFSPAALVITRVISLPDSTKLCLDLGHKSIAAEGELHKRVYFLNAPDLVPVSQSEEHLVVEAGAGHNFRIGDVLYGLPIHICPTVALYERAITIEDGVITGEWMNSARDRKLLF